MALVLAPDPAEVVYFARFLPHEEADQYLHYFLHQVDWHQDEIQFYGKRHLVPRLTAWYGDRGASYVYSKIRNEPRPWTPDLLKLLLDVEDTVGAHFNSVLLNRYRSGSDSLSWHSDDEPELGDVPVIASVSLGVSRTFLLRKKSDRTKVGSIKLEHGSLLVMKGHSQQIFQHSVPKEKRADGERVNLTFRVVQTSSAEERTLSRNSKAARSSI